MKKIWLLCFLSIFLVSCMADNTSETQIRYEQYIKHYEEVIDNTIFSSKNAAPFEINVAMNKLSDGSYRYDIIIDNPKVAMYNIEVIAIENSITYQNADKLMPTFGIFDDGSYNMIPYQTNVSNGYVKGVIASAITTEAIINLKIKVTWTDYARVETSKIFIEMQVDFNNQDDDIYYPTYEDDDEIDGEDTDNDLNEDIPEGEEGIHEDPNL